MTPITYCRRCGGSILSEPFNDASGAGNRMLCMACGESEDHYASRLPSQLTARELNDLMRSGPRGRPRKVRL